MFVFATPRRCSDARDWERQRGVDAIFADVRVVPADDHEGWLDATRLFISGFSEELDRQPRGAETLERWWSRFRSQTIPALPTSLFLASRNDERRRLVEFFKQPPGVIAVQAPWRDCVAEDLV